ncbi:MAG: LysR family transcriptional regulator [Burkholderiaceae bacterium]|nr:LysR family transcriptional regulator [Burkholderiaceae bacterium]
MTLEQLRVFVAVAERGHMTQAAQQLHITQSAASAAVAALEQRYSVHLFNRVGRGLELSEAGRVFLVEARAVLARSTAARRALDELAGLKRGTLRIAASQTVASYWLPQRMAQFAQSHPDIDLLLQMGNTQQVAQAVADAEADLGFIEGLVELPALTQHTVGHDRLSVYAAPGHPLAQKKMLKPKDLVQASWVLREQGSGTRTEFESSLIVHGIQPCQLKVLLTLPSNEAVMAAVAAGGTLTAVSDLAAAPRLAAGTLKRLPLTLAARAFVAIQHRERTPSRALAAFAANW